MSRKGSGAKWGFLGAIAGAIAGLLFAPKSGKDTREDIKEGAVKVKTEAEKKYADVKEDAGKKAAEAKVTAEKYVDKTKRAATRAVEDVREEFKK